MCVSYLYVNFLFVQNPCEQSHKSYDGEGTKKTNDMNVGFAKNHCPEVVDALCDAQCAEDRRNHLAEDVEEERVHAEHLEDAAPACMSLDVDDVDEDAQKAGSHRAGHQCERGRPDALVEGEAESKQIAYETDGNSNEEQLHDLLLVLFGCHDGATTNHTNEGMGDTSNGAY